MTMAEDMRLWREDRRQRRAKDGIDCPGCAVARPKAQPTRLMPGKTCKVCGMTYAKAKGAS
jgi:rubredoxin